MFVKWKNITTKTDQASHSPWTRSPVPLTVFHHQAARPVAADARPRTWYWAASARPPVENVSVKIHVCCLQREWFLTSLDVILLTNKCTWVNIYLSWFFSCHNSKHYLRIYLSMCVCFNLLESLHDPCQYLFPCFSEPSNFETISKSFSNTGKNMLNVDFETVKTSSNQWLTSSNCHHETKCHLEKMSFFGAFLYTTRYLVDPWSTRLDTPPGSDTFGWPPNGWWVYHSFSIWKKKRVKTWENFVHI